MTVPNVPNVAGGAYRRPREVAAEKFINPYNFVSTPDRSRYDPATLGDCAPTSHARVEPDTYSGSIPITITTRTPLLLPDQPRSDPARGTTPRTAGTRTDPNGAPLLLGSTVKGMLRSAYEAITNSRFGVVDDTHRERGAVRAEPDWAKGLCLGRVTGTTDNAGNPLIEVAANLYHNDDPDGIPQPAPWVPGRLDAKKLRLFGLTNVLDLDTREVEAWIHLKTHPQRGFKYWSVSDLAPPGRLADQTNRIGQFAPVKVRGVLHWTGSTFPAGGNRKHDERLLVTQILDDSPADLNVIKVSVTPEQVEGFGRIIASYSQAHDGEETGAKYGTYVTAQNKWCWRTGRTMYVKFSDDDNSPEVIGLSPAMIGRLPFPNSPLDLIDDDHRPATAVGRLSPADRVFGWTRPDSKADTGQSAHRAKIRITAPTVVDPPEGGAILPLPSEPILATLNGPKTTQYRFYVGDEDQNPLADGQRRDPAAGFNKQRRHRLRGRKFYAPQPEVFKGSPGAEQYWTVETSKQKVEVGGQPRYREYLQSGKRHPEVELAVKSWVKPGVTFETTLHVDNMTGTEIGALLWLLALPEEASLGLGLGKPLGFGSVRVTADWGRTQVRSAESQRQRYTTLVGLLDESTGCLDVEAIQKLIKTFDITLCQGGLRRVRKEFLDMVCGYTGAPVHYPRARASGTPQGQRPAPNGEFFKWWVANEKTRRLSLPGTDDPALPYLDDESPRRNDVRRQR